MSDSGAKLSDGNGPAASGVHASPRRAELGTQERFSSLLAGLMHESRNALQQISAGAELLGFDLANRPEAMHLIRGIEEGQNRLVRVLDDLRLYATPQTPSVQTVDLASLSRKAWHALATSGLWRAAELQELEMPAACACHGDPGLVEAMVSRSLEFVLAMADPPVVIQIACRDISLAGRPGVALTIGSPGLHWTAAEGAMLFDPFAMRRGRANGLELPVVRRLVELHGGNFRAFCDPAGQAELVLEMPR